MQEDGGSAGKSQGAEEEEEEELDPVLLQQKVGPLLFSYPCEGSPTVVGGSGPRGGAGTVLLWSSPIVECRLWVRPRRSICILW